mgnify:CR=1 FL=1
MFSNVQIKDGALVAGGFYINQIIRAAQIAMCGICDVVITSGRDGNRVTTIKIEPSISDCGKLPQMTEPRSQRVSGRYYRPIMTW